jgi:hypothetical protein
MARAWLLGLVLLHGCGGGDRREIPAQPGDLGYRVTRSGDWYHFRAEAGAGVVDLSLDAAFGREAGIALAIEPKRFERMWTVADSIAGQPTLVGAPWGALSRGLGRGNVLASTLWTRRDILVCWEASAAPFAAERRWVEDAILGSWQRHSSLRFEDWGACEGRDSAAYVRLGAWNDRPRTRGLGRRLAGMSAGVMLNFTNPWPYCRADDRQRCVENIAIHEFGHVLGFAHEQNRADTPNALCAAEDDLPQGPDGDVFGGPWDKDSVMNYCGGGSSLSNGDIAAVQLVYGPAPRSSASILYRRDVDYVGGVLGASEDMVVGERPCLGGFTRAACDARLQPDGKGWCGQARWLSDDPSDCRCEFRVGVGALQRAHCVAEVLADPPSAADTPVICGDAACDPSESCMSCGEDCGPCTPAIPGDQIVEAAEENFVAGILGARGEERFGGACPPGLRRRQCVARRQSGSVGWCGRERWLSEDEGDCRCAYQVGVGPLQRLHCTVQVTAGR